MGGHLTRAEQELTSRRRLLDNVCVFLDIWYTMPSLYIARDGRRTRPVCNRTSWMLLIEVPCYGLYVRRW
jgi:hypothetical protein